MRAQITTYENRTFQLPTLLACRLEYACGSPCDAFWLELPAQPDQWEVYRKGVGLTLGWEGETVFTGIIDETECSLDGQGGKVTISGRSMAARLLDNQARPADYAAATLDDILRNHVTPYGIPVLDKPAVPPCFGFSVGSGQSEWQVLSRFARYHGGLVPRFDRLGRLCLAPFPHDPVRRLTDGVPLLSVSKREKRYGAISEVLVLDKKRQQLHSIVHPQFSQEQGCCRRVVTAGAGTDALSSRYSARFQLEESLREKTTLSLTAPTLFFAWPGEWLRLERSEANGLWQVRETVVTLDEKGGRTTLELVPPHTAM